MPKVAFKTLLHKIGSCEIFQNNSNCPQAPVEWQLLVPLANLGLSGKWRGQSSQSKTVLLGRYAWLVLQSVNTYTHGLILAVGSVDNYTNQCIYTILQLERDYVPWPNAAKRFQTESGLGIFKDCVGLMDGTLITFAAVPARHKEDYWTCKSVYGLNSRIICDHQHRVIYAHHEWCGSAHNKQVLKPTLVCDWFTFSL